MLEGGGDPGTGRHARLPLNWSLTISTPVFSLPDGCLRLRFHTLSHFRQRAVYATKAYAHI